MPETYDLIVIGGGPAGGAAAITAAGCGGRVLLLEQGKLPRHKVCGEFISAEAHGLLAALAAGNPSALPIMERAPRIERARVFADERVLEFAVRPPALSIARFDLDVMLWKAAEAAGVCCRQQSAASGIHGRGPFTITTLEEHVDARCVIDASGRWSRLRPARRNQARRDGWIGLKAHFEEHGPSPSADLYFFGDGYCGVQPVGQDLVNVCAMARAHVARSLSEVFALHPQLQARAQSWEQATELLVTFPLKFHKPVCAGDGVLMAGDAAGFIDPFVGDGISIALRCGALAARLLAGVWRNQTSLAEATAKYRAAYAAEILPAFRMASRLRRFLMLPSLLRRPLLEMLRSERLAASLLKHTRAARPR